MELLLVLKNDSLLGDSTLMSLGYITLHQKLSLAASELSSQHILLWPSFNSMKLLSETDLTLTCKWAGMR